MNLALDDLQSQVDELTSRANQAEADIANLQTEVINIKNYVGMGGGEV